jgi:hypothetical protein
VTSLPLPRPASRWRPRERFARQAAQPIGDCFVAAPPSLHQLVVDQSGVATRQQLATAGLSRSRIDAELTGRRWQAFGSHVVVLQNGPLDERQRAWVAVLLTRKPAALCGLTAIAVDGLTGFESDTVHVVVAHDTHAAMPRWVKIHESRRFSASDILRNGIPRTRAPRSAVDAATWSRAPRRACAILCASVQQRLTTARLLASELRVAGPIRHAKIMREIVGDISGGGHTLAEIDLAPLARQAGLASPRRQAVRREPSGHVRYLDAEFDLPDGRRLAVEIDGAVHLQTLKWWDDLDRQNELVIAGDHVLRFPSVTVRLEPAKVIDQLTRMRLACS